MNNGEAVKYQPGELMRVTRSRGWFRQQEEFWAHPSERLTMVPIKQPQRFPRLRRLWLSIAPAIYSRHKTRKSHLQFLAKCGVTDPETIRKFGTEEYIADQQVLISAAPPPYDNGFDARKRTRDERAQALHKHILEAIKASQDTDKVTHLRPSDEQKPIS
jgi:hypothetical protein